MATVIPSAGVDENEPTLIREEALQDTDGAEYRVGQQGIYVARGRDQYGDVGGFTGLGLYEAGFDSTIDWLIAHYGNTYAASVIGSSTLSFSALDSFTAGSSAFVGTHYANRHYLANGVGNRRIESTATGLTSFAMGMSTTSFAVGVSVTQGAGSITATTGLEYWATEYDSSRGIESIHGSTANTGAISSLDSVIVTVTGTSTNPRADQIRWYRSVDGGGYPDGGLLQTTAIGTTQITDSNTVTDTLTVPNYGTISIGGLDTDRDEAPPVFTTIFGPFQDSLLGVNINEQRVLRFTPAGYPDSWPSAYGIPLETPRHDIIIGGVVLGGRIGVFCRDSVHVIYRLPRDSDSIFAAGEAQEPLTLERGGISRRGATIFVPPGSTGLGAFVARDGIFATDFSTAPVSLTDGTDWESRVDVSKLDLCRLVNDPLNRRLVFIHRKASDTTHNTGIWYLDYQHFTDQGIRITFADHGPLVDATTIAYHDGLRRLVSFDSRPGNGQVYVEAIQDVDDSQIIDSSGSVRFRVRTKEFFPATATGVMRIGKATWMHDAGPPVIEHRCYFNRRANPGENKLGKPTIRNADDINIGHQVNSFSLELSSVGTVSYGVHWIDVEGLETGRLGGLDGA